MRASAGCVRISTGRRRFEPSDFLGTFLLVAVVQALQRKHTRSAFGVARVVND
jgi:hypothetical protein